MIEGELVGHVTLFLVLEPGFLCGTLQTSGLVLGEDEREFLGLFLVGIGLDLAVVYEPMGQGQPAGALRHRVEQLAGQGHLAMLVDVLEDIHTSGLNQLVQGSTPVGNGLDDPVDALVVAHCNYLSCLLRQ
ncbi:hypothetical protein [Pseudomonas phage PaP3]|uniref:Uncharacterized protein n=1 Tax=Pseudomonas phage PaP3 TaxID=2905964 RepID=A0A125QYI2_9CAUD|nr:hypothetical protein PaP3p72 [Pseudomonas phage PaP3]AMA22483.1 hypothetical protein [Pseudomonas phage PaP3]